MQRWLSKPILGLQYFPHVEQVCSDPRVEVLPGTHKIQVEIIDQIDKEHEEWEEDCSTKVPQMRCGILGGTVCSFETGIN